MNTHAVPAPPERPHGTHQSGRLCLEVARKNTAHPGSRAVVASGPLRFGVLLAAPYSCRMRVQLPRSFAPTAAPGFRHEGAALLPVGCPQPQLGGASFVASRPFGE